MPSRSPMRNRVTPLGDIVAVPLRGAWLGNRGILHEGTDVVRFHRSALWIICTLSHKDWRLPQWQPHHFTVLFFHDEAVAMAAGHRPCALCRRADYNAYRAAWVEALGGPVPKAWQMDRRLHGERIYRGTHRRRFHPVPWRSVPSGATSGGMASRSSCSTMPYGTGPRRGTVGGARDHGPATSI